MIWLFFDQFQRNNPLLVNENPLASADKKPKSIFEDSSDELFQTVTKPQEPEPELKKPDEQIRKPSIKPAGNNQMLFNPSALASSNLFKKLRQKSESDESDFGAPKNSDHIVTAKESETKEKVFGQSKAPESTTEDSTKSISNKEAADPFGSDNEIFASVSPAKATGQKVDGTVAPRTKVCEI